eukprot:10653965-Heterocapsa_arctica.AAC.1
MSSLTTSLPQPRLPDAARSSVARPRVNTIQEMGPQNGEGEGKRARGAALHCFWLRHARPSAY